MKPLKFTITGDPMTKKNKRPIFRNRRTGRVFLGKSGRLRSAETAAVWELKSALLGWGRNAEIVFPIVEPVAVRFMFYRKTHRRCDLSNLLELPQDALVKAGILQDDSLIESLDGSRKLYDPKNPRTEIIISTFKPHA